MLKRVLAELLPSRRARQASEGLPAPSALESAAQFLQARRYEEAQAVLDELLRAEPKNARALSMMGEVLVRRGAFRDATARFRQALVIEPSLPDAWYGLGSACHGAGDTRLAHLYYRTSLTLRPRDANALNELGLAELELGNPAEAESAFREAVNADPSHARAWSNLGLAVAGSGDFGFARRCFRRAVSLKQDFYMALCNLGLACRRLEMFAEAREALQRACALRPAEPDAWLNLGAIHQDEGLLDEALGAYERAQSAAPRSVDVLTALGDAQMKRGQPAAAEGLLSLALEIAPQDAEARLGLAHLRLAEGDFERGWPLYEARLATRLSPRKHFPPPAWDGSSLSGKSVLLYGEQGLGDEIMFASMLPDVQRDAAACRLVCHPRLQSVFKRSFPGVTVLAETDAQRLTAAEVDVCVPLGSLGGIYRRRRDAFPRHQGYLRADSARVEAWRRRLRAASSRPWIGISWRGGLTLTGRAVRSLTVDKLRPLFASSAWAWASLQHRPADDEWKALETVASQPIHRWDDALADLDEMSALISALDLVLTVCCTNVHLAGALGRPTWILTPHVPAWRYQLRGETLPWYPSTRMFRQPRAGDWEGVIDAVCAALEEQGAAPSV